MLPGICDRKNHSYAQSVAVGRRRWVPVMVRPRQVGPPRVDLPGVVPRIGWFGEGSGELNQRRAGGLAPLNQRQGACAALHA